MTKFVTKFGEFIKRRREELGKTQKGIGQILGLSGSTISLWEEGKSLPRFDLRAKVARFYGMTQEEIREMLDPVIKLDAANHVNDAGVRTIRLVHATSDCLQSKIIDDQINRVVREMARDGWKIHSGQTTLAVFEHRLKPLAQWCATLVFER